MRKTEIVNAEQAKRLIQSEIHRTDETRLHHRLHCILLMCNGSTCAEVATLFDDRLRTVQHWTKSFNERGIDGLRDAPKPGRKPRLLKKDQEILKRDLRESPRVFGYSQNLWDGKILSHHVKEIFGVDLKVRQCQKLFHDLGFRRRKPRPVIAKADPEAQEAYKKTQDPGRK